ncbi:hypothetical protein [Sphingomonas sp. NIBR02145]|uniref:hypothetical protein n=1 Tax=Sphingomonas sp. NIBR02145 TaxID=3014784 RepID=UPI0022B30121|nr:hypothetical protein [Sphingomonas sp. NIBR02145]WHU01330.1 hypothetical protein O3305_14090 [Sphingomonas sp. NIBR02145]
MLAVLLAFMNDPALSDLPRQWAQFSRTGALNHISENIDIATGDRGTDAEFRYILRRTKNSLNAVPEIAWADSATCPAVRSVIASMRKIQVPSPAPYGLEDKSTALTLDGTGYSLTAPSSDNMGKLTISSNIGTPLAAWVDTSLKQLEACWRTTAS